MNTMLQYLRILVPVSLIWLLTCSAHQHKESNGVVVLQILPRFLNENIDIEHQYILTPTDTVKINTLRFYIGHIELWNDSQRVGSTLKPFYLIDVARPASQTIEVSLMHGVVFSRIHFTIGIDSATNYMGASSDDLDPANGMYWTWQSGYIHFKLEGTCSLSPHSAKKFNLHLGGYRYPFNTMQTCHLPVNTAPEVVLNVQLDQLLSQLEWTSTSQIMSPGQAALELSKKLPKMFTSVAP